VDWFDPLREYTYGIFLKELHARRGECVRQWDTGRIRQDQAGGDIVRCAWEARENRGEEIVELALIACVAV